MTKQYVLCSNCVFRNYSITFNYCVKAVLSLQTLW